MAHRALNSQCRVVTIVLLLLIAAFISYRYESSTSPSAKFRYTRDPQAATSPDDTVWDYPGNGSYGLTKRAIAPECTIAEAQASRVKGCQLTNLMIASQSTFLAQFPNGISKWAINDLGNNGWTRQILDDNFDPATIAPFLIGLNNVEEFQSVNLPISTASRWAHTQYTQDRFYIATGGVVRPETWGNYEMVVTNTGSNTAGVIILLSGFSPAYMNPTLPNDQLPQPGIWSDVGYLEFGRLAGFAPWSSPNDDLDPAGAPNGANRLRSPPTWLYIPVVKGPVETMAIVSYCMRTTYGLNHLPPWQNRVTFPIGSYCFNAIVGTEQVHSLARLLITHKYRIRRSTLGSITVWGSGINGDGGYESPSLLVWVATTLQRSVPGWMTMDQIRQENSIYASTPGSNLANFPHRLRPM